MLWVYYQQTPLPVPVDRADKIVSVYVLHNARSRAWPALIIAAIVAAALSPSTNALAATTVNDFYRPYVRPDADDAHLLRVSRHRHGRLGARAAGSSRWPRSTCSRACSTPASPSSACRPARCSARS